MRVIVDEQDVIREVPIATGKGATYIAVDVFKKMLGMVRSMDRKGRMSYVCMGTDFTREGGGVIKR